MSASSSQLPPLSVPPPVSPLACLPSAAPPVTEALVVEEAVSRQRKVYKRGHPEAGTPSNNNFNLFIGRHQVSVVVLKHQGVGGKHPREPGKFYFQARTRNEYPQRHIWSGWATREEVTVKISELLKAKPNTKVETRPTQNPSRRFKQALPNPPTSPSPSPPPSSPLSTPHLSLSPAVGRSSTTRARAKKVGPGAQEFLSVPSPKRMRLHQYTFHEDGRQPPAQPQPPISHHSQPQPQPHPHPHPHPHLLQAPLPIHPFPTYNMLTPEPSLQAHGSLLQAAAAAVAAQFANGVPLPSRPYFHFPAMVPMVPFLQPFFHHSHGPSPLPHSKQEPHFPVQLPPGASSATAASPSSLPSPSPASSPSSPSSPSPSPPPSSFSRISVASLLNNHSDSTQVTGMDSLLLLAGMERQSLQKTPRQEEEPSLHIE